jgi:hypothetical protein
MAGCVFWRVGRTIRKIGNVERVSMQVPGVPGLTPGICSELCPCLLLFASGCLTVLMSEFSGCAQRANADGGIVLVIPRRIEPLAKVLQIGRVHECEKFVFGQDLNTELLRFCQFAASGLAGDHESRFL